MTEEEKAAEAAKLAAEKLKQERASINVETNEAKEETEIENKEVEKQEDEHEENKEKIEEHQKTEEELETEKAQAKTAKEKERIQKRIDKEVGKRKALEQENEELKRQLAAKPDAEKVLTEEEVEKRAEILATQKHLEREFTNACNRLADAAAKVDKDFPVKVKAMGDEIGPIPGQMIGVLDDLENGGEVLAYLADNLDEAEEIYVLSPAKMAVQLTKIGNKVEAAKKEKVKKPISKVPDPTEPISGGQKQTIVLSDKEPMEDWVAKRNRQVAQRKEARMKG